MLDLITEAISTRSFASVWYWIALAAFWTGAMRRIFDLPMSAFVQARRSPQAMAQLETLAHLTALRLVQTWTNWQFGITAFGTAGVVLLSVLAFGYDLEMAQALWFFALPYGILRGLTLRAAYKVLGDYAQGAALLRLMQNLSIYTQLIGMAFILASTFFGIVHLATHGFLR